MRCVLYADNRVVDVIEDIGLDDKETLKCNCPNCGAPINGHTCEYCGTILDPIAMEKEQNELSSLETELKYLQAQLSQAEQSATLLTGFSNLFNKNRKGY